MVAFVDFYEIFCFTKLLQSFCCCYLSIFSSSFVIISGSSSDWLGSSAAASLVSITSAILLLRVSCLYYTISTSVADVTTSMSKLMYSSMSVSEESCSNNSRNSASILFNLIIIFRNTKRTRIPLHTFEKHKSTNRKIIRRGNDC